jgi:ABC-type Zn uptake system ZnuABC Zn-binding protein ZnuA
MASVIVKRNILLKAIVTDVLKQEVSEELQEAADEITQRLQELDVAGRRYITDLQRTDLQRAMALRQQVEAERKKQEGVREQLLARKQQVAEWKPGEEVVRGTLEGFVEVKEGDNIAVVLGGTEMVVEDDVVKAIRETAEPLDAPLKSAIVRSEAGAESDVIGTIEQSE